jgi:acyl-CoA thioesterase-1
MAQLTLPGLDSFARRWHRSHMTLETLKARSRQLKQHTLTVYFAARDPRTPLFVRVLAVLVAAYALSPIDLIPDFIPIIGYLDDIILIPLGLAAVVWLTPPAVLESARVQAQQAASRPVSYSAAAFIVAIWLLLGATLFLSACNRDDELKLPAYRFQAALGEKAAFIKSLETGNPQKIVAYGTSLTSDGAWVDQLQEELDRRFPKMAEVVNSGERAMWSRWGVDNLRPRVLDQHPNAVLIEFSINDAFLDYNTSVSEARYNLETMISRIAEADPDCEIILMIMNPPTGVHLGQRPNIVAYEQMYREVAQARNLRLIDFSSSWQAVLDGGNAAWQELVQDGIHPNTAGSQRITTPYLLEHLGIGPAR